MAAEATAGAGTGAGATAGGGIGTTIAYGGAYVIIVAEVVIVIGELGAITYYMNDYYDGLNQHYEMSQECAINNGASQTQANEIAAAQVRNGQEKITSAFRFRSN